MSLVTELREELSLSWEALRANKMRSALTALVGIIDGIVTVTVMGAAIAGLNRAFHSKIYVFGADTLYVQRIH